jgi:hypothetical protein
MKSLNTGQKRILGNGVKAKKAKHISPSGKRTINILGRKVFGLSIAVRNVVRK